VIVRAFGFPPGQGSVLVRESRKRLVMPLKEKNIVTRWGGIEPGFSGV